MNIRFEGATVLVTGAAHGIGREIAHRFAALGARVWAADVLAEELEATAVTAPGTCLARPVDVTDGVAVSRWVAAAEADAEAGAVDILVTCAGGVLGQRGRPVEEVAPADWQALLDVNVTGAFHAARAVAPAMKRRGRGRIVTISSGAGIRVSQTGIQAYAAAKAALIGLTRQLAHELGPHGITVNSVAPGFVRSNPDSERQWEGYGEEGQRRLVERIALRRLGTPADIADAVLFLASPHAAWITGQVLEVNGGR